VLSTKEPPPGPPLAKMRLADPRDYVRSLLSFRPALLLVASQFAFWFGVGGVTPFLTRYAVEELGFDEPTAFGLFLLLIGFTAVFSVPAGFAGDRLGKKRVLLVGLLVFALAAAVGSRASTLVELGLVLAVIGFANAITTSLGFAFLTELLPRRRMGELTGLSGMTWSLAQPLGSTIAGLVADYTGTLRSVLLFAAVALLISFLVMMAVKPQRPH
jgi:maltose/moltooligosaccharide transporter